MIRRKRIWKSLVCAVAMSLLCACGNVLHVEKSIEPSELYSGKSINEAMNVVIGFFFFHYDGCTLKRLEYNEEFSTKRSDEWAEQYDADEAIVLLSEFEVDHTGGDGSLEPNSTYRKWQWILVRDNGGAWRLKTWGYG